MLHERSARAANFVPSVIHVGGDLQRYGVPQCELGFQFFNGTGLDITVTTRTGLQFEIPALKGVRFYGLIIRTAYTRGYGVKIYTDDLSNDRGEPISPEAEKLDSALFRDEPRIGRPGNSTANLDYVLSKEDFVQNGGSIYLPNLDLSLSILAGAYAPKHPYSLAGFRSDLIESDPLLSKGGGLSFQIRIVDRHKRFGDKFINLNGEVFHIRCIVDSHAPDGVYIASNVPATGVLETSLPRTEFFTFDDARKNLSLYDSYIEAKTLGNPADVYKRQIEERSHELKLEEHRLKAERLARDADFEERKRALEMDRETAKAALLRKEDDLKNREYELSRMEQEYRLRENQIKRDTLILKEMYEEKAQRRKEVLEYMKYAPALATAFAAVVAAYKKSAKSE